MVGWDRFLPGYAHVAVQNGQCNGSKSAACMRPGLSSRFHKDSADLVQHLSGQHVEMMIAMRVEHC